jgi:hypothetical protein
MNRYTPSNESTLLWLLEEDNPGVRYLAMRDLLVLPFDDPDLVAAKEKAHCEGPIANILDAMHPEGYWVEPGPGYNPKYRSTVWSIMLLAQLGANINFDQRIQTACQYLMEHAFNKTGQFSANGGPSGTADCLQGNLCSALLEIGYEDPRLDIAFEWMARTVTGEGIAPFEDKNAPMRYYAGKRGPGFICGSNNNLPCAWGASKVMLAFSKFPGSQPPPFMEAAIKQGIDFLLSVDPVDATYPSGWSDKPSGNWWKFGFPLFYVSDILQVVEALVALGQGSDPRLKNALDFIYSKQDENGRWLLEYDYADKTWYDFGTKKQPNKWVTYRAARVLNFTRIDGLTINIDH